MQSISKHAFLLIAALLLLSLTSHSAIRFQTLKASMPPAPAQTTGTHISAAQEHIAFIRPHTNPDDAYTSTIEGIISLTCVGFVALSLIALSVTSFSFFVIPAIIFSVGAIIFGAIGLKHHKRGNAIVGMIAGLIGLISSFFALAALP